MVSALRMLPLLAFLLTLPVWGSDLPCPAGVASETLKDFTSIATDYAFFESHATEELAVRRVLVRLLSARRYPPGDIEFLDFGAGRGQLAEYLSGAVEPLRGKLRFSVVEPMETWREEAVARLTPLSRASVGHWDYLPPETGRRYEILVANHVFYYVKDLRETLVRLRHNALPGATLYLTLANDENALNRISQVEFARIGRPWPLQGVPALERAMADLSIGYRRHYVTSEVRFPDSRENRLRILRFMHGEHFGLFAEADMLADFEPYQRGSEMVLPLYDHVYEIPL